MNGKTSIDFDGAGLGQYPQYPLLSMNKASCSYEYIQRYYRKKKRLPRNSELIITAQAVTKKKKKDSHKKKECNLEMFQLLLKKRFLQNISYKITFDKITCQFFQSSLS